MLSLCTKGVKVSTDANFVSIGTSVRLWPSHFLFDWCLRLSGCLTSYFVHLYLALNKKILALTMRFDKYLKTFEPFKSLNLTNSNEVIVGQWISLKLLTWIDPIKWIIKLIKHNLERTITLSTKQIIIITICLCCCQKNIILYFYNIIGEWERPGSDLETFTSCRLDDPTSWIKRVITRKVKGHEMQSCHPEVEKWDTFTVSMGHREGIWHLRVDLNIFEMVSFVWRCPPAPLPSLLADPQSTRSVSHWLCSRCVIFSFFGFLHWQNFSGIGEGNQVGCLRRNH